MSFYDNFKFWTTLYGKNGPIFCQLVILPFQRTSKFPFNLVTFRLKSAYSSMQKIILHTRVKLNYTTTSAGCYKDWWLSKEWWQELRVSLETTLYMSTIIKYSKAVITSQLFFCIENLQFSFEKVLIIVDAYTYVCILIYYIRHCRKKYSCKNYKHRLGPCSIAKELSLKNQQ